MSLYVACLSFFIGIDFLLNHSVTFLGQSDKKF